ncbi:MAG: 4Fe-4S dicluster domain-containing protein [Spirochaetales bacterium]|nr:4Fe-4S dicluster domain-containing protein [Spirochaetales bacterium]
MDDYRISGKKLKDLMEVLSREADLYAPVKKNDVALFKRIDSVSDINLDYRNTDVPSKNIVFPQTETIFSYTLDKDQKIEPPPVYRESIVFGIRPCDAHAMSILDSVFRDDFKDPYFLDKRKKLTLIGLSCDLPGASCFCTSLSGGPGNKTHLDMLFTRTGDDFFVEVVTEKGKAVIEKAKDLFKKATDKLKKQKDGNIKKAEALIKRNIAVDGIKQKLDKLFDSELWKELSQKCMGCSICTYLCPTCHCFDIQDEKTLEKGRRVRVWDSCAFPEYTLHASGHNPRPARMNRLRNRVYHKYSYYPDNFDMIACVGCGRCIEKCPVNIDLLDVLKKVKEAVK